MFARQLIQGILVQIHGYNPMTTPLQVNGDGPAHKTGTQNNDLFLHKTMLLSYSSPGPGVSFIDLLINDKPQLIHSPVYLLI